MDALIACKPLLQSAAQCALTTAIEIGWRTHRCAAGIRGFGVTIHWRNHSSAAVAGWFSVERKKAR